MVVSYIMKGREGERLESKYAEEGRAKKRTCKHSFTTLQTQVDRGSSLQSFQTDPYL